MRATSWPAALLVFALLAGTAVGQVRPGEPQPEDEGRPKEPAREAKLEEPAPEIRAESFLNAEGHVALDKYRERIVVLFFFRADDSASVEALPILNRVHKELGPRGVVVIGLTPEKKEKAESIVKGKEVQFIVGFGAETEQSYKVTSFPLIYLIDTAGILVNRFHPLENLEDKLQSQIARTPPAGADIKSLQNRFAQARTALGNKEYGRAYTLARDVEKLADKESALGKAVAALIAELNEAARKWLEEAKEAAKGSDYAKACRVLSELSVRFAGTDIGGEADNEIARLMGNRDVKPQIRKALDNAKGQLLNDQAADHEASGRFLEAIKLYRQASEDYPGTEAAEAADKAIERIAGDPRAQEIIAKRRAEEDADRWLDIADRFAKVEMYGKAREFYQRILNDHPETRAASKARERLARLPEAEPSEELEAAAAEAEAVEGDEPDKQAD